MVTQITRGVQVSVHSTYEAQHSKPKQGYFVFSYRIRIENKSSQEVQLMRRHWRIFDTLAGWHEVEGEGVVSQKPILYSNEEYQYESFCPLMSDIGKMYGSYLFENKSDGSTFIVKIPVFELVAPYRLS